MIAWALTVKNAIRSDTMDKRCLDTDLSPASKYLDPDMKVDFDLESCNPAHFGRRAYRKATNSVSKVTPLIARPITNDSGK